MKEIGEKLRVHRKENSVTLEEASSDLGISVIELENIEAGNYKAFKDIYELKRNIKNYAKYLGLDEDSILDDFNDYLFEKTSKIKVEDINKSRMEEIKKEKELEKTKIHSPYTNFKPRKKDYAKLVLGIMTFILVAVVLYLVLLNIRKPREIERELWKMEDYYELAQ